MMFCFDRALSLSLPALNENHPVLEMIFTDHLASFDRSGKMNKKVFDRKNSCFVKLDVLSVEPIVLLSTCRFGRANKTLTFICIVSKDALHIHKKATWMIWFICVQTSLKLHLPSSPLHTHVLG